MRADLAAALKRKQVGELPSAERIKLLREAVEQAEERGDLAAFTAALGAYEDACLDNPGAEACECHPASQGARG